MAIRDWKIQQGLNDIEDLQRALREKEEHLVELTSRVTELEKSIAELILIVGRSEKESPR